MIEPGEGPARITAARRRPWQIALFGVLVLGALGYAVSVGLRVHDWALLVFYGVVGLINFVRVARPPTVVSADGVRRPWRRPSQVLWADVTAVLAPRPGLSGMRLQLANGKKVPLDDIPSDQTAAVAAIGGQEVVRPARPVVTPGPPRPPGRRTDQDVLVDVTRQAAALARQREELAEQARRMRPS